jgi:hypothetical protein
VKTVDSEGEDHNSLPFILNAYDGDYSAGTIALATNGIPGAYFDNISLNPLECSNLL